MEDNKQKNLDDIKNKKENIYKKNKDNVPIYLDKLKEEEKMKIKISKYDNNYLKYML